MQLLNSKTNKKKEIPKIITHKKKHEEERAKVMSGKRIKTMRSKKPRLWNENGGTMMLILIKS